MFSLKQKVQCVKDVLTNLTVFISQCVHISNSVVHLTRTQFCMLFTSQ